MVQLLKRRPLMIINGINAKSVHHPHDVMAMNLGTWFTMQASL